MTDPRHTDPPRRTQGSNATMWGWIAGIAAVILLAFVLAAGWNDSPQTAGNEPPATVGSGGTTMPPSTADRAPTDNATGSGTTGSGAADNATTDTGGSATGSGIGSTGGAPAATPSQPATPAPDAGGQPGGQ